MREKWKRRCNGAISIFLVIIFIANMVLVGVLVDAGRYRMARATAEMALDSATASVLSYYNKLLYDLYGVFATDTASVGDVRALLTDYVSKTLGLAEVDTGTTTALTDALLGALDEDETLPLFDGYGFAVEVEMADSQTLANTDLVEYQIIEHMKYRAPLAMAAEAGSFLEKLGGLGAIIDRVGTAIGKAELVGAHDKEALAKDAAALMDAISKFNRRALNFSADPQGMNPADTTRGKDGMDYVRELDAEWGELAHDPLYTADEAGLLAAYDRSKDVFIARLETIAANAETLHREANDIRDTAGALTERYDAYIAELRAKVDAEPSNENVKTVYLPEIELAESTCGELLKNIDLVLMGRQYTLNITRAAEEYNSVMDPALSQVIDTRVYGRDGEFSAATLAGLIAQERGPMGRGAGILISELTANLGALNTFARDFEEAGEIKVKTVDVDGKAAKDEAEDGEVEAEALRDLFAADLRVDYTASLADGDWNTGLEDSVDTANTARLLKTGLTLLSKLAALLEDGRDSLYINEYALAYFPNYVQHYAAVDSPLAQKGADSAFGGNSYLIDAGSAYSAYSASQAELEYLITGEPRARLSVAGVSARLLGLRTIFNVAAIFTDAAKISQANTLAASVSGPFAPLVATALLIAWAVAESVIDVTELMDGEEVYLFKQGKNWTLSASGAFAKAAGKATSFVADGVAEAIGRQLDDASAAVEQLANKAVYRAYKAAAGGVEGAVGAGRGVIRDWTDGVSAGGGSVGDTLAGLGNQALDAAQAQGSAAVEDLKDRAVLAANDAIRKGTTAMKRAVSQYTGALAEELGSAISGAVSGYLPGSPAASGSNEAENTAFSVKLDYLDYLRIFLLFSGNSRKVERIQSLIQANIRYGTGSGAFSMGQSYGSVAATMRCTVDFMFMGSAFIPAALKRDGGMTFAVYSHRGY